MKRLPGWRGRLDAVLTDARKPFAWFQHDCCMGLVVPAVQALTGEDIGAPFRDRPYTSALGALKAIKDAGFDDLEALAASHFPEGHPSSARVGDIAAFKAEDTGWALGIVIGSRIGVLRPDGYGTLGLLEADKVFLVG
jgi:hypothetical protein